MSNDPECSSPGARCAPPSQLRLYQTFIFATPILFTFVLLLLFCLLYIRRRRNARAASQIRAQFFTRGLFAAPLDHGLNKSFRDNIPTILFDPSKFAASGVDSQCAVCLGEYQLNEKLQQLPTCGHTFHLDCIDEWLAGNSTCPICRTSLLQPGRVVPVLSSPPQQLIRLQNEDCSPRMLSYTGNSSSTSSSKRSTIRPASQESIHIDEVVAQAPAPADESHCIHIEEKI